MKNKINTGQNLWIRAKEIIPGGNQLLSKRSEIFLPNLWPAYYEKAKGCIIWDLDGNKFYDFAGMGVTSCVLGYADKDVDNAVCRAIKKGTMSTLNSHEEIKLAEKLISLHPWSKMIRFAKTGGEACTIAMRIARAASGKDKVAFCGYHGWHDWYISSNLTKKGNLDNQLLPGLRTNGVAKGLKNTSIPFYYNDINSFKKVISNNRKTIGTIIMEPTRGVLPEKGFLQYVKKTASKIGAVLIFDEITSGFHDNLGGIHLKLGVNPDIAIFSKAIGNGYPIAAILGTRDVMDIAQDSFISSTMWTERIGFTAALAAISKMEKYNIQKHLVSYGLQIKEGWKKISQATNIPISIAGLDSIPNFKFHSSNSLILSTYFIQEMLELSFLANNSLATSFSYSDKVIKKYLKAFEKTFLKISKNVKKLGEKKLPLKGPIRHSTFKRLTE
jgi:glutamate-1-semialdehyde aminotransferase